MSPLVPSATPKLVVKFAPDLRTCHVPVDGRYTVTSVFRSPSKSPRVERFVTLQANVWLLDRLPSDAVTVTAYRPALVVGNVPAISPVTALMVSAGGRPVALYVSRSPSGSLAWSCN